VDKKLFGEVIVLKMVWSDSRTASNIHTVKRRNRQRTMSSSSTSSENPPSLSLSAISSIDDVYTPTRSYTSLNKHSPGDNSWYEHIPALAEEAYVQGSIEESGLQADLAERNVEDMLFALTNMASDVDDDNYSIETTTETLHHPSNFTEANYSTPKDSIILDSAPILSNNLLSTFEAELDFEIFKDDRTRHDTSYDKITSTENDDYSILTTSTTTSNIKNVDLSEIINSYCDNTISLPRSTILNDEAKKFEREMMNISSGVSQQSLNLAELSGEWNDSNYEDEDNNDSRIEIIKHHLKDIEATLAHTKEMEEVVASLSKTQQHPDDYVNTLDDPKSRWYVQFSQVSGIYYFQPTTGNILRVEPESYCDTSSVRRGPEQTVRSKLTTNDDAMNSSSNINKMIENKSLDKARVPRIRRKSTRMRKMRSALYSLFLVIFLFLPVLQSTLYYFDYPILWNSDTFNFLSQTLASRILHGNLYTTLLSSSFLPTILAL